MANQTIYPYGQGGTLPSSIGIVNDLFSGGADKALSAEQGKVLNENVGAFENIDLSSITEQDAFIRANGTWLIGNSGYKGVFLPVQPGETYVIQANSSRYSLFALLKRDTREEGAEPYYPDNYQRETVSSASFHTIEVPEDAHYLYMSTYFDGADHTPESLVRVNGIQNAVDDRMKVEMDLSDYVPQRAYPLPVGSWLTSGANDYRGIFVPCVSGRTYIVVPNAPYAVYYIFLKSNDTSSPVQFAEGYESMPPCYSGLGTFRLTAPGDATYLYLVSSFTGSGTYELPKNIYEVSSLSEIQEEIENFGAVSFPTTLKIGESQKVLYTRDNVLIKYGTENETDYIYFSDDLGKTWTSLENTYGDITHIHLFATGTILFCTSSAAYYTKDFVTVTESVVYDYDGSTSVPSGTRFYSIPKCHKDRVFIDGEEWHTFWDYIITTTNPRCWYSNDDGKTVRCAFAFGLQQLGGAIVSAKHVHDFQYNRYDGKFYCFTGDSASECHIMRGVFSGGSFAWEKLKTGGEYKLTSIYYAEGVFYAVTDFTEQSLADKKGILRCPINDIDADNYFYLFHATNELMGSAALSAYFCDNNGWRVASTDYLGGAKTLIAKNNWDLVWVDNSKNLRLWSMIGPNDNGDIYAQTSVPSGSSGSGETWLKLQSPSINLTEAMRNSGAKNFCDYKISKF